MKDVKPEFSRSYKLGNEILVSSHSLTDFPFSIKKIVQERGNGSIACKPFSKAALYGVDITTFGSESATIFAYNGRYIIFYNEEEKMERVRFSIGHELGHYLLGHDFNLPKGDQYDRQEVETNFFAAQLLMPEQILKEFQKRSAVINKQFLMTAFGVSEKAAIKRIETLAKTNSEWRSRTEREFDDVILIKFAAFIDHVCPQRRDYYDFDYEEEMQNKRNGWL